MNINFNVAVGVFTNFKIQKLVRALGYEAIYNVIALWSYVAENRPLGVLTGMDAVDVALAGEWDESDAGTFVGTLVALRLIDKGEEGEYSIHGWDEWNPFLVTGNGKAKKRSLDFKISVGFLRHLKTRELRRELGDLGVIALIRLWAYVAEFKPKGVLDAMSLDDIEVVAGWCSRPVDEIVSPEEYEDIHVFGVTLLRLGFLDKVVEGYAVHGWPEWNAWACGRPERSEKARKAAAAKHSVRSSSVFPPAPTATASSTGGEMVP